MELTQIDFVIRNKYFQISKQNKIEYCVVKNISIKVRWQLYNSNGKIKNIQKK